MKTSVGMKLAALFASKDVITVARVWISYYNPHPHVHPYLHPRLHLHFHAHAHLHLHPQVQTHIEPNLIPILITHLHSYPRPQVQYKLLQVI